MVPGRSRGVAGPRVFSRIRPVVPSGGRRVRSLVQLDAHARVCVASRARNQRGERAGRGLGDPSGLEPRGTELETLQARRPGFRISASPPRKPNLCCSSSEPLDPGGAGRAEQGSRLRRRIREHLLPAGKGSAAAAGAAGVTPPGGRSPDSAPSSSSASSSLSSSPQPPPRGDRARDDGAQRRSPAAHLCRQKSSSLPGTACLEQLLEPSPPPAEPAPSPAESRTPEKGEECGSSRVSDGGSVGHASSCGRSRPLELRDCGDKLSVAAELLPNLLLPSGRPPWICTPPAPPSISWLRAVPLVSLRSSPSPFKRRLEVKVRGPHWVIVIISVMDTVIRNLLQ
ncbi:hypothetical protein MC885_014811, partial [Smutsia gigantea]